MTNKILRSVHVTRFGPWMRAAIGQLSIPSGYVSYQQPTMTSHPAVQGYAALQPPHQDVDSRTFSVAQGMLYKGDTIVLGINKLPEGPGDETPKKFQIEISNRVRGAAPTEDSPTFDDTGYTWRTIATACIQLVEAYVTTAPAINATATRVINTLEEPGAEGLPTNAKLDGKVVRVDPSFFTSPEFAALKGRTASLLRRGVLMPTPPISKKQLGPTQDMGEVEGGGTYWSATAEMEWIEAPTSRVDEELPAIWHDVGTEYVVYSKSFAESTQSQYEAARDGHNAKLEAAVIAASKGNAVSANLETELKTRPQNTTHALVKEEADAWWNKVHVLVHELGKVADVSDVTDANLVSKYPNGAGGMAVDELDRYIKAKRQAGDTQPTKELIDGIAVPPNQKTDQAWWSRVLDTVDGFGAGTKEVLKDWGPMGTVGAYGGVKAVNGVSSGNSNWLWAALAAGVAILLLK